METTKSDIERPGGSEDSAVDDELQNLGTTHIIIRYKPDGSERDAFVLATDGCKVKSCSPKHQEELYYRSIQFRANRGGIRDNNTIQELFDRGMVLPVTTMTVLPMANSRPPGVRTKLLLKEFTDPRMMVLMAFSGSLEVMHEIGDQLHTIDHFDQLLHNMATQMKIFEEPHIEHFLINSHPPLRHPANYIKSRGLTRATIIVVPLDYSKFTWLKSLVKRFMGTERPIYKPERPIPNWMRTEILKRNPIAFQLRPNYQPGSPYLIDEIPNCRVLGIGEELGNQYLQSISHLLPLIRTREDAIQTAGGALVAACDITPNVDDNRRFSTKLLQAYHCSSKGEVTFTERDYRSNTNGVTRYDERPSFCSLM